MKRFLWIIGGVAGLAAILVVIALIIGSQIPREHEATASIVIASPPQAVWDEITDIERHPEWRSQLQTVKTVTPGQKYQLTVLGSSALFELEVVESEPPRRAVWLTRDIGGPMNVRWRIDIEPRDEGCAVTIRESGTTDHPWFRFVLKHLIGYESFARAFLADLRAHALNRQAADGP